jgi:uncharacterized OB-fold protein
MTEAALPGYDLKTESPLVAWQNFCRQGQLAYQASADGQAVFHPRVAAPGSGAPLQWKIAKGTGTVYATTVVRPRDAAPYNLALIDLDEGFRMMSRVEGIAAQEVRIGLRVRAKMVEESDGVTRPVFQPLEAA